MNGIRYLALLVIIFVMAALSQTAHAQTVAPVSTGSISTPTSSISTASTGLQACQGDPTDPCTQLCQANLYYSQQAAKNAQAAHAAAPPPNLWTTYCLGNLVTLWNGINTIIGASSQSWSTLDIGAVVRGVETAAENAIVNALTALACQYVRAVINAVLAQICIPLPSFGFSLGLSLPSGNCSGGIPLVQAVSAVAALSTSAANGLSSLNSLGINASTGLPYNPPVAPVYNQTPYNYNLVLPSSSFSPVPSP